MSAWRERLDEFPTQLVLTIVWTALTFPATLMLAHTGFERIVVFVSFYAVDISHFTGHLAWRAKRAAQQTEVAA